MAVEAATHGTLYYVYALAAPGLPRRFASRGRTLRAIDIGDISAIVERVRKAPDPTERTLREQHAIVGQLAARVDALLPARFGALFTPAELRARVKAEHDVIRDALDRVRGRVQMTVRLYSASAPPPALPHVSSGTAYLAARSERERALRRDAARIRRAVSRFVGEQRLDSGKGDVRGTLYHLIRAEHVDRYRTAVEAFAPSLAPVRLTVSGPWPAFAFVPELRR